MHLFMTNLSTKIDDSNLRRLLSNYATIASVAVYKEYATQRHMHVAFVEIPNYFEAEKVIDLLDGVEMLKKRIRIIRNQTIESMGIEDLIKVHTEGIDGLL